MRRDKLPVTDTQILLLAEFTLPAPPGYQTTNKPETLGLPTARRGKPVCRGPAAKPTEVKNLFTMSKIEPGGLGIARNREESGSRCFVDRRHTLVRLSGAKMVEAIGIEPTTFCLQSRCSPN